jgi:capsular polysaccharide biosynthesis protein
MRAVADAPGTEQEIDLRNYVDRILNRWWIVAIFVVLAVVASFTITRTSNKNLTQGTATVYLGQPVSPNGSLVPNPLSSNPLYATALAKQRPYQEVAEQAAGLDAGALKGHVSVALISTAVGVKGIAVPLAQVTVQGPFTPAQSAAAANSMAEQIVAKSNTYTDAKKDAVITARDSLQARIDALAADADDVKAQLDKLTSANLGAAERASLSAPLLGILQYDSNTEALLQEQLPDLQAQVDYIQNVEGGSVITPARGAKVAPQSKQFSLLIAIVLGLIVGVLVAILSTVFWPVRPVIETEGTATP